MNIGHLLFSPNGRIGQQEYWIGVLIIIAANIVANFIPILGFIVSLGLIYVGVCVYGKRLHDTGRTAWIHAVPWAVSIVLGIIGMIMVGGAVFAAMSGSGEVDMAAMMAGSSGAFLVFSLSFLVWIAYTIWVGVLKGDAGANQYGEPVLAGAAAGGAAPAQPSAPPASDPAEGGSDEDKPQG
ncbi:hypothetical protein DDZ18_12165 [Marinicauda salina]|uniref:DUF805 domain-containing protein n=1 Tax=Marinicauda salina TaxID=2135793 RepID=A0A2U2BRB2_9PROT|nr:DUF805 domain-containing protein [Marinicauda salina]PWE16518.1 hypothetical protein DDZ18_12165 [Marinicauda salina]